ncbi:MAG: Flp family type IVb pilin [Pirellulaceae bacterium]|nr:Flp family type IVb pilin [Pirellulaceae bacterium]
MIVKYSQGLIRLWRDEDGPTTVEYAIMLALIVAVCIASVQTMTQATEQSFQRTREAIDGAMGN